MGLLFVLLLCSCSAKKSAVKIKESSIFAAAEEETAPIAEENQEFFMTVKSSDGEPLTLKSGEEVTLPAVYETATGGEIVYNENGETMTTEPGLVMTYAEGSPVIGSSGEPETYQGGEEITNVLGLSVYESNGEKATRSAGETVTHGEDDIIYDADGNRKIYTDEPLTHSAGETMLDENGEPLTKPVVFSVDAEGEHVTDEYGNAETEIAEIVTLNNGEPRTEVSGEAATRLAYPETPEKIFDTYVESGAYYISNLLSAYVYLHAEEVNANNIYYKYSEDSEEIYDGFYDENGNAIYINNVFLDILGPECQRFNIYYDLEGYAYIMQDGTGNVLTAESADDGANVTMEAVRYTIYPQFKNWENAPITVEDSQKWIIKKAGDGTFVLASALNENYVLTVNDFYGMQGANLILLRADGRDEQLFCFTTDEPKLERYLEEGNYFVRSGLTSWMMMSIANWSYADWANLQLETATGGDNQLFTIYYDEYGFATIAHNSSSEVLTVPEYNAYTGQNVCQIASDGGLWQKWILEPNEDGGFYIRSALNYEIVINLFGSKTYPGANIGLYVNDGTYSQYWYFMTEAPYVPVTSDQYMTAYAQGYYSPSEYLIMVDTTACRVGIFQGSQGNWEMIYYWLCAPGRETDPTVLGEFCIEGKNYSFDGNTDSPDWYTCYYVSGFHGEYLFHSIIYYQGTWDVMADALGAPLSHGCVRLATENAKWIYDNAPIGTTVVTY